MVKNSKKIVGIKEIAKLSGVSIGTIDRVLHDRPGVSERTKKKVNEIIKEVGYNPNPLARRLAGFNSIYRIALILPRENDYNPYWKQHLIGIQKALDLVNQFGIELDPLFFDQGDIESFQTITQEVKKGGFDAVVIAPLFQEIATEFVNHCHHSKIPVVCIDTDLKDSKKLSFIGQDAYQSGLISAKLISWHLQADQKVLICHSSKSTELPLNFQRRESGFRDLLSHQTPIQDHQIVSSHIRTTDPQEIKQNWEALQAQHPTIKCVFFTSARSFLITPAFSEKQKEEIFVVSYDLVEKNIELLNDGTINVIISQKPEEQCYKAIMFIYEKMIANKQIPPFLNVPIDIILKENIQYYLG